MIKKIKVEEITEKIRLDAYIASKLQNLSRSMIQKLLEYGKISVNDKNEKSSYKVQENDLITIKEQEPQEIDLKPQDIPLNIIYEDDDFLVINKEKGMVVHPGARE